MMKRYVSHLIVLDLSAIKLCEVKFKFSFKKKSDNIVPGQASMHLLFQKPLITNNVSFSLCLSHLLTC